MEYRFEDFTGGDVPGILDVFNYFVEHTLAAYPVDKVGDEFAELLEHIASAYPVITVKDETGGVLGFGLLHAFHPAGSFRRTAEISYFLRPSATRRGIGGALLARLVDRGRAMGLRTLLASISSENEQSLAFHRTHGFEEVGRFRSVGHKKGRDFDVVYMQRSI